MSYVEELHRAHLERIKRLNPVIQRAPEPIVPPDAAADAIIEVAIVAPKIIPIPRPTVPLLVSTARYPKVERIQRVVADYFGVTVCDMKSDRRSANVVWPRHVAMYLARVLTLRSLPEIARRFGDRDHTTAMHAAQKVQRLVLSSPERAQDIATLSDLIESGATADKVAA